MRLSHNKEKQLSETGNSGRSTRAAKRRKTLTTTEEEPDGHGETPSSNADPATPNPAASTTILAPESGAPESRSPAGNLWPRGESLIPGPLHVRDYRNPLEALSLAAEQSAFQNTVFETTSTSNGGALADAALQQVSQDGFSNMDVRALQSIPPSANQSKGGMESMAPLLGDVDVSFDNFAAFLESETYSSHQYVPFLPMEDPMAFFPSNGPAQNVAEQTALEEQPGSTSFSRFGSRLPSLQPDEQDATDSLHRDGQHSIGAFKRQAHIRKIWHVSAEDRQAMAQEIAKFDTVPRRFQLPSRMSLARYIRAYVDGFHEHMPFLHVQTMTVEDSSVELLLAMAAVGAQYCFEAEKGVDMFHAARAIATERIRRRDARIAMQQRATESGSSTEHLFAPVTSSPTVQDGRRASTLSRVVNGPLGLPSDPGSSAHIATPGSPPQDDLMQSAQALLILMAMATWAKHKEILREALAIQSVLASLVRDDGLNMATQEEREADAISWEDWARQESVMRTKYIVFCFFNLHSIVYDIPPLLLNWEISMPLPCRTSEFKAESEVKWREIRAKQNDPPSQFQNALRWLFSKEGEATMGCHSALGNYVLIHAIIQHIFLIRQTIRCRVDGDELTGEDVAPLEQALRRWQMGWNRSPESSTDPMDPNGPVPFNSTALLRLAYIRLNMDTGPGRALGTRDPMQIAQALREMPPIKRTPKLVRALLHSAHALSIPVKMGVRLVSKTQAFIWSIQHSLCSLECALLLSKWLETVSLMSSSLDGSSQVGQPPISAEERKIFSLVMTMLDETEFAASHATSIESPETAKCLSAGVLRVWATIFRGAQTWAIVDVIGCSLNIYADMLEAS